MGYTIEYIGRFELNKPLTEEHAKFLQDFAKTRHYHRVWSREEENGRWFVDPEGSMKPNFKDKEYLDMLHARTYDHEKRKAFELEKYGCIDFNEVNPGMPSFYCQWIPTEDRKGIEWDGGEKFYNAEKWLRYIIENYLKPWGYVVNGTVEFEHGEPEYDSNTGALHVSNNKVFVEEYEEEPEEEEW